MLIAISVIVQWCMFRECLLTLIMWTCLNQNCFGTVHQRFMTVLAGDFVAVVLRRARRCVVALLGCYYVVQFACLRWRLSFQCVVNLHVLFWTYTFFVYAYIDVPMTIFWQAYSWNWVTPVSGCRLYLWVGGVMSSSNGRRESMLGDVIRWLS